MGCLVGQPGHPGADVACSSRGRRKHMFGRVGASSFVFVVGLVLPFAVAASDGAGHSDRSKRREGADPTDGTDRRFVRRPRLEGGTDRPRGEQRDSPGQPKKGAARRRSDPPTSAPPTSAPRTSRLDVVNGRLELVHPVPNGPPPHPAAGWSSKYGGYTAGVPKISPPAGAAWSSRGGGWTAGWGPSGTTSSRSGGFMKRP